MQAVTYLSRHKQEPLVTKIIQYLMTGTSAFLDESNEPVFEGFEINLDLSKPLIFIEQTQTFYVLHINVSGQLDGEEADAVVYTVSNFGPTGNHVQALPIKSLVHEHDCSLDFQIFKPLNDDQEQMYMYASTISTHLAMYGKSQLMSANHVLH